MAENQKGCSRSPGKFPSKCSQPEVFGQKIVFLLWYLAASQQNFSKSFLAESFEAKVASMEQPLMEQALNYEGKLVSETHLDIIHLTNAANDTHHPWKALHTLIEIEMNRVSGGIIQ